LELLAAAGSTAITELTLPLPSCLLLLNDDAATSGGGAAAAAGTASVAIPNYLLKAFSRKNPLSSSLYSSSSQFSSATLKKFFFCNCNFVLQLLLLSLLQTFLKKSDKTQLQKCNSHTTDTHTLSLSLQSKFLQQKMYVSETKTEKSVSTTTPKKTKNQRMGLGVLFPPEAHDFYVISKPIKPWTIIKDPKQNNQSSFWQRILKKLLLSGGTGFRV
jgi:hypothetical protein